MFEFDFFFEEEFYSLLLYYFLLFGKGKKLGYWVLFERFVRCFCLMILLFGVFIIIGIFVIVYLFLGEFIFYEFFFLVLNVVNLSLLDFLDNESVDF